MLAHVIDVLLFLNHDPEIVRLQLSRALLAREKTAWTQDHHQYESKSEDQIAVLPHVMRCQEAIADLGAKGIERSGQSFSQDSIKRPDEERADNCTEDIAHAAEDNGR